MHHFIAFFTLVTPAVALAVVTDGVQSVPEPSVIGLIAAGAIGAGVIRKISKKNR